MRHELRIMVFALLFMILYSLFMIQTVHAQTPIPSSISPTSPLYTDMLVHNMFHTFSCLAVGSSMIGQPCLTYQVTKNAQGTIQSIPVLSQVNLSGGTLGATTSLIGALYANPPVRTADYLASVGTGLGIVKEANAQVVGSGAQVLSPILTLWQVSRNIAYLIMIIIFVIIGLMVMFRNRINPQTVITAQTALPGLVIGLILITFSYFLAGLISDTAFVGTNMVGYFFTAAKSKPPQNLVEELSSRNVLSIFTPFTRILTTGNVRDALSLIWNDLGDPNVPFLDIRQLDPQRVIRLLTTFLTFQILSPIGGLVPGIGQAIIGGIALIGGQFGTLEVASWSLAFIGMVALIYTMFRLLLRLINNYLTIIFLVITAPFQFLFASLPGRQGIATSWILNLLSNVLAFPAVIAVLYFVAFILGPDFKKDYCDRPGPPPQECPFKVSQINQIENNTFVPSVQAADGATIVGKDNFPLLGGFDLSFVRLLLAFGALLALPAIPDIIKRAMGTVSQAGQLIGQEIGAGTGAGQRYAGQIQQGTQGAVGQFGRLTNAPGYMIGEDELGNKIVMPTYAPGYGAQFGTAYRLRSTLSRWTGGRIKPPKSPV